MSGGAVPTTTGPDSVSEVLFRAGRWWSDALASGLLDADVTSIDGWRVLGSLRGGDGFTMSDIALALTIPPPMTR